VFKLDTPINGDNFAVELIAKNDPSLVGGSSAYDLGFGMANAAYIPIPGSASAVNSPAGRVAIFVMTNGYFQDFFTYQSSTGAPAGQLSQPGAISTLGWTKYKLEATGGKLKLYAGGSLTYTQSYSGQLGQMDRFYISGKLNLQIKPLKKT
jgi:hypothetical protein